MPDEVSAFVIFETLNDRGLTLATTDLIKNYFFGKSGTKIGEVQQRWITMNSTITAAKDEEAIMGYVRHQWSANNGLTREKELFTKIRDHIKNANSSLTYATKLATDARVYAAMLNTELEFWNNYGVTAKQHMQAIELIGVDRMRPLILAALSNFTITEAKKVLRMFVAWSVRFLITSTNWGTLERQFSEKASQISKGLIKDAKALRTAMMQYVPVDSDFEVEFSTTSASNGISRYLLQALERSKSGVDQPDLIANANPDEVSLEHILPKNPAPGTWTNFDPETTSLWARKLGNLCLLPSDENGAATNAEFAKKQPFYTKSNLKLTAELARSQLGTQRASKIGRKNWQRWRSRRGPSEAMTTTARQRRELSDSASRGESLTTAEAATLSGYARDYISLMIRQGVLEGYKRGRDWFVDARSLHAHVDSNPRPGRKRIN